MSSDGDPAIFHLTHWKAGSQWVRGVLQDLFPDRTIEPYEGMQIGRFTQPILPGQIYSPVYLPRHKFETTPAATTPHRKFLVARDLRDTLISWYFSLKNSHPTNDVIEDHRVRLKTLPTEEALVMLVGHPHFSSIVRVPATWAGTDIPLIRFEDLVRDPMASFMRILEHCGLEATESKLADAISRWSFEAKAGRTPGQEDPESHFRKGIVGDWRNHFTPQLRVAFNNLWGSLLVRLGYEKSGVVTPPAPTP